MIKHLRGTLSPVFTLVASLCLIAPSPLSAQEASPVYTIRPFQREFFNRVEALGTVRAVESIALSPSVTGVIERILFNDGDTVEKGDPLVELVRGEELALLEEARARLKEAERQFERVKTLVAERAASQSAIDERRFAFESAAAQVRVFEARLRDRVLVAPFRGVMGLRSVSEGALVQPGDVIGTLDDTSTMLLDFAVPTLLMGSVPVGTPIVASADAYQKELFEGVVSSVDSRADEVTRSVVVRARVPNREGRLKPGLLMTVELRGTPRTQTAIPEESIVQRGVDTFVLVIENDGDGATTAVERRVTVGNQTPGVVEIMEGVTPEESIVVRGGATIRSGSKVRIEREITERDVVEGEPLVVSQEPAR